MERFANIQGSAKSQATIDNYNSREIRFLKWLRAENPACWINPENAEESHLLMRITTSMLCTIISIYSENKDGTMKSPQESNMTS